MHHKDPHDHMVCNCAEYLNANIAPFAFCDNVPTIGEVFPVASLWTACLGDVVAAALQRAVRRPILSNLIYIPI